MTSLPLHLGVALDGAGWHPAAWRDAHARPDELFTAPYWVDVVREAERGGLDFVTIDDSLGIQSARWRSPDVRIDQVRGRLDAVLLAARVAPATSRIGIIPTATTTHTEPFHVSKAIATLDWVSHGRAGVQVRVSSTALEAALVGRRDIPTRRPDDPGETGAPTVDLFDEAADFVEVLRRLWDSWEDDAEIRDAVTGRFVDRHKLHYIDFEGRWFAVKGPSITPRPPQGQPVVAALAHSTVPYRLAARQADVVFVTPHDADGVRTIVAEVRHEQAGAGRPPDAGGADSGPTHARPTLGEVRIFADVVTFLDDEPDRAATRLAALDAAAGRPYRSDAFVFAGTPGDLADLMQSWLAVATDGPGLAGFRLRPGTIPYDLEIIGRSLVPELQRRGVFPRDLDRSTLRERLGLGPAANRYARTGS